MYGAVGWYYKGMKNAQSRLGFTLIEIMVVISIISLLASVLYINFNAARENSRDQVRKTDLKQLQLAVELYKAQNGRYPESGCGTVWAGPGPTTGNYAQCDDWIVGLVPEFIAELPLDPNTDTNQGYFYRTDATGSRYKIKAYGSVERNFITSYQQDFARCPRPSGNTYCAAGTSPAAGGGSDDTYALYSFGAERW